MLSGAERGSKEIKCYMSNLVAQEEELVKFPLCVWWYCLVIQSVCWSVCTKNQKTYRCLQDPEKELCFTVLCDLERKTVLYGESEDSLEEVFMSINVIINNLCHNQCVSGVQKVRKSWLKCHPVKPQIWICCGPLARQRCEYITNCDMGRRGDTAGPALNEECCRVGRSGVSSAVSRALLWHLWSIQRQKYSLYF